MRLQPKGAAAKDAVLLAGDKIVSVSDIFYAFYSINLAFLISYFIIEYFEFYVHLNYSFNRK